MAESLNERFQRTRITLHTHDSGCLAGIVPLSKYLLLAHAAFTEKLPPKTTVSPPPSSPPPPPCFQEVLDIARLLLAELGQHNDCEIEEKKSKLEQLKTVLEM